jgi:hypothetical protein
MKKASLLLIIAACCAIAACKKKKEETPDPFNKIEGTRTWHFDYRRESTKANVSDTAYQLADETFSIDYHDDRKTIYLPKLGFMDSCYLYFAQANSKEDMWVFNGSVGAAHASVTLWYYPSTDSIKLQKYWMNWGPHGSPDSYTLYYYVNGHTP